MKHSDFRIGREFMTGAGRWRCTDVGTRTVTAIRLDMDQDGIEGCESAPRRRAYDDSGRANITTVPAKIVRKRTHNRRSRGLK